MKRVSTKKQIYEAPVVYEMAGAMAVYVLAGSPKSANGLERQQNNNYNEMNYQENSIVDDADDVLAKPMHNLWGEE